MTSENSVTIKLSSFNREILKQHQIMQLPKVPHGSLERKENMAAWSFPWPGRVSDPTLFRMTLVATLLATVLGE